MLHKDYLTRSLHGSASYPQLLTVEVRVQSQETSYKIHGGTRGIGAGIFPSFFDIPLLIII